MSTTLEASDALTMCPWPPELLIVDRAAPGEKSMLRAVGAARACACDFPNRKGQARLECVTQLSPSLEKYFGLLRLEMKARERREREMGS